MELFFFIPTRLQLPLTSKQAHLFQELDLSYLAQFPKLASRPKAENDLRAYHPLYDPHHRFWIEREGAKPVVKRSWKFHETIEDTARSRSGPRSHIKGAITWFQAGVGGTIPHCEQVTEDRDNNEKPTRGW